MAIRKDIVWTVADDGSVTPTTPQDGGVQGEHHATRAVWQVGQVWQNPNFTLYVECEDSAGNVDTTEPLQVEGGQVSVLLPLAWTQYGGMSTLRLVAEEQDGTVAMTAEGLVRYDSRQNASQKVDGLLKTRLSGVMKAAKVAEDAAANAVAAASSASGASDEAQKAAGSAAAMAGGAAIAAESAKQSAEEAKAAAEDAAGGGESYTIHETEDHSVAISDESGNVVATVKPNGEIDGNFPDKVAREKLKSFVETDKYAAAFCDEQGYVACGVKPNGEKVGFGGEGGMSVAATIDFYKCGLPVLALVGDASDMTKENAVDLSYTIKSPKGTAIATGTCSCKWQGSSSVRKGYPKRNYTIKLDNAVEATRAISSKDGVDAPTPWGEQKKYCLKANWIDPSAARNVVNAKLWGEIVASRENVPDQLAAAPNYGAIDGFPCIILINGEFEGLYTFNIPKDGWMFNMGEGLTEYVVCGEENGKTACGFYSTPTFVEDENGKVDYSVEYKLDDVADETVIASFQAAVNAVKNAPNSADWESAVAPYFDIDSAIDYYIFVCCISGHDNLRRNTLYATYDGVKWFISAYDLDTTYGSNPYGTALFPVKTERTQFYEAANGSTRHRLFELIYKYSKDKLKARYAELRSTVLSDENVWYAFNNFVCNIPRAIYNMDAEKWADKRCNQLWPMPATTTANVENYIQYYRMHTALLDKEMED